MERGGEGITISYCNNQDLRHILRENSTLQNTEVLENKTPTVARLPVPVPLSPEALSRSLHGVQLAVFLAADLEHLVCGGDTTRSTQCCYWEAQFTVECNDSLVPSRPSFFSLACRKKRRFFYCYSKRKQLCRLGTRLVP